MKWSNVKKYKFKLEEDELRQTNITGYDFYTRYMRMRANGRFWVKYAYTWDGSSLPFKEIFVIVFLGIWKPDKYCKTASLIHDALCQAMREKLLPATEKIKADKLYRAMIIEGAMAPKYLKGLSPEQIAKRRKKFIIWANIRYQALRKFGDSGIKPEKNPRNKIYDTEKGE